MLVIPLESRLLSKDNAAKSDGQVSTARFVQLFVHLLSKFSGPTISAFSSPKSTAFAPKASVGVTTAAKANCGEFPQYPHSPLCSTRCHCSAWRAGPDGCDALDYASSVWRPIHLVYQVNPRDPLALGGVVLALGRPGLVRMQDSLTIDPLVLLPYE